MLHSCGDGALTVDSITIFDDVEPAEPSVYWAIGSPGAEGVTVPAHDSQIFSLLMTLPNEEGATVNGKMSIVWSDGTQPQVFDVTLSALADSAAVPPIASTGPPENYLDLLTGEAILLDGAQSQAGVDDQSLDAEGYLWFVVDRPAESTLEIAEEWGGPTRFIIPDAAGTYAMGLLVKTDSPIPLISQVELLEFSAAEPEPDPDPDPPEG